MGFCRTVSVGKTRGNSTSWTGSREDAGTRPVTAQLKQRKAQRQISARISKISICAWHARAILLPGLVRTLLGWFGKSKPGSVVWRALFPAFGGQAMAMLCTCGDYMGYRHMAFWAISRGVTAQVRRFFLAANGDKTSNLRLL